MNTAEFVEAREAIVSDIKTMVEDHLISENWAEIRAAVNALAMTIDCDKGQRNNLVLACLSILEPELSKTEFGATINRQ